MQLLIKEQEEEIKALRMELAMHDTLVRMYNAKEDACDYFIFFFFLLLLSQVQP